MHKSKNRQSKNVFKSTRKTQTGLMVIKRYDRPPRSIRNKQSAFCRNIYNRPPSLPDGFKRVLFALLAQAYAQPTRVPDYFFRNENKPFFLYSSSLTSLAIYPSAEMAAISVSGSMVCGANITVSPLICDEVTFLTLKFRRTRSFTCDSHMPQRIPSTFTVIFFTTKPPVSYLLFLSTDFAAHLSSLTVLYFSPLTR